MLRRIVWKLTDVSMELTALMMEAVSTSETAVKVYQSAKPGIPEDSRLHVLAAVRT
jgi:hypothetical protein